jgi:hypothetical protein
MTLHSSPENTYTYKQWRKLDPISGGAETYSQLIIFNTPIFQFFK